MFAAVGIKVNARPMTSQAATDLNTSGEWDMRFLDDGYWVLPFTNCNYLAPMTPLTPGWNREGSEPRVLRDWEQEMVDLVTAYCKELDPAVRKELISQYNYLFTSTTINGHDHRA